jgi:hypothetical protein
VVIIKIIKITVLCICLTFSFSFVAKADYSSEEFQKSYFDVGYKEIHKALQESNEHMKRGIPLPVQLPPVAFTHNFGRFDSSYGESHGKLEIEYLNKDIPQNHFMIFVQPDKYGLPIRKEHIDQTLTLKDGSKAIYSTKIARGFNLLVFEKGGFQYVLSVDKRISDKVTPEILMEITNSIQ